MKKEEIDLKYRWDLTAIYKTDDEWNLDFDYISSKLDNYKSFENKLNTAQSVLDLAKFSDELEMKLEKMGLYAFLSKDLDLDNKHYQTMYGKLQGLYTKFSEATSFITTELLQNEYSLVEQWIASNSELAIYKHHFENLFRTKEHILSKAEERILALSSLITPVAQSTFSLLKNADLEFPTVKDPDGNDFPISDGKYSAALFNQNREFRKDVYLNYYKPYKKFANTLSSLLNGNVKAYSFTAKARGYKSTLEASLKPKNIPLEVYHNLIETTNNNLKPLHRWAELRKKILKLDELHPYDTYVSLFPEINKKYSYDEGVELVLKACQPLGEQYILDLKVAFENRRIDVYESKGKRSGAYSSGTTYGQKPFVLMNWNEELNDVFTLAHEMGHNMHSLYTGQSQPYIYAGYTIFLAEVASTLNEALLLDYLIKNSTSKIEKLSLLEIYANKFVTTFYRQIGFAEFEYKAHQIIEAGQSLNSAELCKMYAEIYSKYWGSAMVVDEEESYTWSRVPHFYTCFYVYQYATGLAASEKLSKNIIQNGQVGVNKLFYFLNAGKSDYSINILRNAGADMMNPETILACIHKFDSLITEIENSFVE